MGSLTPPTDQANYKILSSSNIRQELDKMVKDVCEITKLSTNASRTLLRQLKWNKQQLLERYYDQSPGDVKLFSAVKTMDAQCEGGDGDKSAATTHQSGTCNICGESGRLMGLQCKHLFCSNCWLLYIKCKVDANVCSILCPASKCAISVDDKSLKCLIDSSPKLLEAFTRAEVNDYVKNHRRVKWCPGAGCERAAAVNETGSQQVDCECGESFCYECAQEWHGPLDCAFLKKWLKQCADDVETFRWIDDNTRDCPRCKAAIEKSGGCNQMVCRKCGHVFCWLCLWPWNQHTQNHFGCNRLNQTTKVANKEERDKTRASQDYFLHHAKRFKAQQQSHKLEKKLFASVDEKIRQFQQQGYSYVESQFLGQAVRLLNSCRLSLMHTFAFAYYLETDDNTRELFDGIQMDLALATESLSGYLERDLNKMQDPAKLKREVQDKCNYVQRRRNTLVKWSKEDGWKLVDRVPGVKHKN